MLLFRCFRRTYLHELLQHVNVRPKSTEACRDVLERWLKGWELVTPPVSYLAGTEPPTALSWLRRRGPAELPEAVLHKLFRREEVRAFDAATGRVSRVAKARELLPGTQLLLPRAVLAEAQQSQQQQQQQQEEEREGTAGRRRPPSPQQEQLRLAWARELRRRVLYHDADLIAVDKPAGLAVQGGQGVRVSLDEVMGVAFGRLAGMGGPSALRLVHRLDRDTTGVLLVAKSPDAAAWLSQAFRDGSAAAAVAQGAQPRRGRGSATAAAAAQAAVQATAQATKGVQISKTYHAVVVKQLPRDVAASWDESSAPVDLPEEGEIDMPVQPGGGSSRDGAAELRGALPSLTKFTVRRQDDQLAWLELRPQTGRKHQLRIHCAQGLGMPILGDGKYGATRAAAQRGVLERLRDEGAWPAGGGTPMFLHCRSVVVQKPLGKPIRVVAPPHPHWQALLRLQQWEEAVLAGGAAARRWDSEKRKKGFGGLRAEAECRQLS